MLVEFIKPSGKKIAVDIYHINIVEDDGEECLIHTSVAKFETLRVSHTFNEAMRRVREARKTEFEEPREPWQNDEDDWG